MVKIAFYQSQHQQQTVSFPTSWNDLSREETETVCAAIAGNGGANALLVQLLEGRAKAERVRLPANWKHRIDAEDFTLQVVPLLDSLLSTPELTRQHYPKLCKTVGPADDFNDLSVAEYEACEYYASCYQQEPSKANLLELIRILWRPPVRGKRPAYTEDVQLRAASFFSKLPDATLHTIFLWYTSCRASLPSLFPAAFGAGGRSAGPDPMAIAKLIHASAGDKNGTRPQVRQTPLKEFLFECNQCALEQARVEELYSKKQ